jgi:salicylate hydroxylase
MQWWVVHRHHLHCGLAEGARRHGVNIVTGARVTKIEYEESPVKVATERGESYTFDLLIGSDGLKSVVRSVLFPDVRPRAATNNAAYRAVIPYEEIWRKVPEAKDFGNAIDVWSVEKGYVITYPISGGKDWNTVLSHYHDRAVTDVEEDVDMDKVKAYFKDVDPRLKKIIDLIPKTKRWPLLITGPLESWSSPKKNVVLMGDAAHSMQNHLAQGAATSIEDGAFLGRVLQEVVRGILTLEEAVHVYEKTRMPRAWMKQQASFTMGAMYMAPSPMDEYRDAASTASVEKTAGQQELINLQTRTKNVSGPDPNELSWNLWGAPDMVRSIFSYDPEGDADHAVLTYLSEKTPVSRLTGKTLPTFETFADPFAHHF